MTRHQLSLYSEATQERAVDRQRPAKWLRRSKSKVLGTEGFMDRHHSSKPEEALNETIFLFDACAALTKVVMGP